MSIGIVRFSFVDAHKGLSLRGFLAITTFFQGRAPRELRSPAHRLQLLLSRFVPVNKCCLSTAHTHGQRNANGLGIFDVPHKVCTLPKVPLVPNHTALTIFCRALKKRLEAAGYATSSNTRDPDSTS
eukprot:c6847_g1_i4.p1 GENE.c6847_g1_i4~~c6847_g1_i4.p1  ORF type:complete len:127 (+),score=15.15 c6847_g1_i4:134-514(+)